MFSTDIYLTTYCLKQIGNKRNSAARISTVFISENSEFFLLAIYNSFGYYLILTTDNEHLYLT